MTRRRLERRTLGAALAGLALSVAASAANAGEPPSALEGAAMLDRFFGALQDLAAGRRSAPVQVLQIGDSHSAADIISSSVRARLQARFGEGGRGVLPPGSPFPGYAPRQIEVAQSDGWRLEGGRGGGGQGLGLSGWRLTSVKTGAKVVMTADREALFDRAVVCAETPSGAGVLAVAAGDARPPLDLMIGSPEPSCRKLAFDGLKSRLELTVEEGAVTLLSFGAWRGEGGVSLSNLGVVGAQLKDFAARDDAVLATELEAYAPDLIVLAFGANEGFSNDLDAAAYETLARDQIRRLKRFAPSASILLLGPPDGETVRPDIPEDGVHNAGFDCAPLTPEEIAAYPQLVADRSPGLARWYPPPALEEVRQAQRRAAAAEGAAFWDWRARMGGPCSAHRLSRPGVGLMRGDHVHFTSDGGDMIAAMLTNDLMAAYAARGGGR